jgi:hypothetical protein
LTNFQWGRLTLAYLASIVAHNWTEAGFKGLSIMYLIFFFISIRHRGFRITFDPPPLEVVKEEPELAYA